MTITKKIIARRISEKYHLKLETTYEIIDDIFEEIVEEVKDENKVLISGFGTFELAQRVSRNIHNIHTGEITQIGENRSLKFHASKRMKKIFNKSYCDDSIL